MYLRLCALLIAMAATSPLGATQGAEPNRETGGQPPPAPPASPELEADANAGYVIEFLGREPANDWAKSARVLESNGLVPLAQLQLRDGEDPCSALLEKLNFRSFELKLGCSTELMKLIRKLNPALSPRPPVGATVVYPDLPIEQMSWYAGFDLSQQNQANRYKKVIEAWKPFKIKETPRSASSQVQVEFRGFQARIPPSNSSTAQQAITSIESYDPNLDRFVTRVLPLSSTPLMNKKYSIADPIGWGRMCLDHPYDPPAPPGPPYISLLHGKKEDLACITNCTKDGSCPEIVLIDQKPAPHPAIARALGIESPATTKPKLCPFIPFDPDKHHGTHMAGIMVSTGGDGFLGLSPGTSIDNRDIGQFFLQNIPTLAKEKSDSWRPALFIFASEFPEARTALTKSDSRYHTPRYVEDILNSQKLWVVAAGQGPTNASEGIEIGRQTPSSPMNLGDWPTVLVVTACENCYENLPKIASWANYSGMTSGGLVNIAAPGGTADNRIPAPVTETDDGLAYGTSQATALVGGLAAAMVSCYPRAFSDSRLLKNRLLTTARPPVTSDLAEKVSVGVVDGGMALHSPDFHWVTLKAAGGVEQKFKEIRWCRERVTVNDLTAYRNAAPRLVEVKFIRRIVRDDSTPDQWYVFYLTEELSVRVGRVTKGSDNLDPLLYFAQGPGKTGPPTPIDEIDDLLVGLRPNATMQIPPGYTGCK